MGMVVVVVGCGPRAERNYSLSYYYYRGVGSKSAYCEALLLPPPFFKPHLVRLIFTNVIQFFLKRLPNLRLPPAFKIT